MKKGELKIQVDPRGDQSAHVTLEGSVDGHTFDKLRKAMDEIVQAGLLWLVIDLQKMDYIASVGLNLLVNARVSRRNVQGDLLLVRPQPQIMKILKMLGLNEILLISSTPEEAWSSIRARRGTLPGSTDGPPLIE